MPEEPKQTQADGQVSATEKKEPIDVLKGDFYDQSGKKGYSEVPIYSVEEYRNLAQQGLGYAQKMGALNALVDKEAERLAEARLESKVSDAVEARLAILKTETDKVNDEAIGEGDTKETSKAIKMLSEKIKGLEDTIIAEKLDQDDKAKRYNAFNRNIGEALTRYGFDEKTFVPIVREVLNPDTDSADKVLALAEVISKLSKADVNIDKLPADKREQLENQLKAKLTAPSPGIEGKTSLKKEEERTTPMSLEEMEDAGRTILKDMKEKGLI